MQHLNEKIPAFVKAYKDTPKYKWSEIRVDGQTLDEFFDGLKQHRLKDFVARTFRKDGPEEIADALDNKMGIPRFASKAGVASSGLKDSTLHLPSAKVRE